MEEPLNVSERSVKSASGYRPACPTCRSTHLLIKGATGLFERMAIFFTRKRKYKCALCGHDFRAHQRRRTTAGNRDTTTPVERQDVERQE
jgi:DNA-directed RNA polymerase subunit RPC12/RpoP